MFGPEGGMAGLEANANFCDILNPLVTIHREDHECPEANFKPFTRVVQFRGNLYIGGIDQTVPQKEEERNILWKFDSDLNSCSSTYVQKELFGLARYNSRLVLIGGKERGTRNMCNKLLTSDDGVNWEDGRLPQITQPRVAPFAISVGDPECLLVVGGLLKSSVEVLKDGQWLIVEPLPNHCTSSYSSLRSVIHNGKLYFHTGNFESDNIFFCNLSTLLNTAALEEKPSLKEKSSLKKKKPGLWRVMKLPCDNFSLVSFGGQLLAFSVSYRVYAYFPCANSWVDVGNLEHSATQNFKICSPTCIGAFPHVGKMYMFVLSSRGRTDNLKICEIKLKVTPFARDGQFGIGALHRLEAAGVPVAASLRRAFKASPTSFRKIAKRHCSKDYSSPIKKWEDWFLHWKKHSLSPVTWGSLFQELNQLGVQELGKEIVEYFSTFKSLQERCRSVILSVLSEQKSLDPDQLPERLPDYVPPTLKLSLKKCL